MTSGDRRGGSRQEGLTVLYKKMRATMDGRRANVKKDKESVPLWDTEAQLAVLVPFLTLCVVVAVCEVTGC